MEHLQGSRKVLDTLQRLFVETVFVGHEHVADHMEQEIDTGKSSLSNGSVAVSPFGGVDQFSDVVLLCDQQGNSIDQLVPANDLPTTVDRCLSGERDFLTIQRRENQDGSVVQ